VCALTCCEQVHMQAPLPAAAAACIFPSPHQKHGAVSFLALTKNMEQYLS